MQASPPSTAASASPGRITDAGLADLDTINGILEAAVTGWGLPARVLRLSLPGLRYTPIDFRTMRARLLTEHGTALGFSCVEPAAAGTFPGSHRALLLHGLYVAPARQRARRTSSLRASTNSTNSTNSRPLPTTRAL